MRRLSPGFGPAGGLSLGHDPFDINAGVGTSHLRLAQERLAARLATATMPAAPLKASAAPKPKKETSE